MTKISKGGELNATLALGIDRWCDHWCDRRALTKKMVVRWAGSANILAGLIGSSLGEALLGTWGPQLCRNGDHSIDHWCSDLGPYCVSYLW